MNPASLAYLPSRRREGAEAPLPGLLSVVVVVDRDEPHLPALHARVRAAVEPLALSCEYLYVLDGPHPVSRARVEELRQAGEPVVVLTFPRLFGRSAALSVAFREARGDWLLTLPLDLDLVDLDDLARLVPRIHHADLVIGSRPPRPAGGRFEKLVRWLLGETFTDLRSEVRLLRRAVADSLVLYGNQHHFLPLVAESQGFLVEEVPIRARHPEPARRGPDLSLLVDLIGVYFLVRFFQKPFRFFGGVGFSILALGGAWMLWLVWQRLVAGVPLADRPALVLAGLLVVLGVQVLAVGLVGELVAFTAARRLTEARIERVVEPGGTGED